tara:strand:- start:2093 stop:2482 length:390 start_codon:yes stop_codon:yes gene_type:complete
MHLKKRNLGFTLIELMIVVVIIGVLASIAYPAYIENVRTAKRSTAQADLMEIASVLERYFTENNTYVGASIPTGITSDSYNYTDPIPDLSASAYTLTAVPQGDQTNDKCGTLTLSQAGAKTPTTDNCWR